MSRSIAPTQFAASGNFPRKSELAAVDLLDCLVVRDLDVDPLGPEIQRDGIAGADHTDLPHKQPAFQCRGILSDQVGKARCPAGIFDLRGQRWRGLDRGAAGEGGQYEKTFHAAILDAFGGAAKSMLEI